MKQKINIKRESIIKLSSSIFAILLGLLVGLIILFISNPNDAINGFGKIIAGGFTDGMGGIGQVLYIATPIIMTGLSVGFAFRTGLFNISFSSDYEGDIIINSYSVDGRLIQSLKLQKSGVDFSAKIDLRNYNAGIYTVQLIAGGHQFTQHVVKE